MADRVRNPMVSTGNPDPAADLPVIPPPADYPIPVPEGIQVTATPTFVDGFKVIDPGLADQQHALVFDVRASSLVDHEDNLDDMATAPPGNTYLSGNVVIKGGAIQSSNYSTGSAGWKISYAGDAEFNNVAIRGLLSGIDGAEKLANGGAELGATTGFVAGGHTTLTAQGTNVRTGSFSFKMVSDGAQGATSMNNTNVTDYPVTAGAAYRLTAYVKPTSTNRSGYVFIQWYDSGSNLITTYHSTQLALTNGSYNLLTGAFIAPANAAYALVGVLCVKIPSGNQAVSEATYVDDISFKTASSLSAGILATGGSGERIEVVSGPANANIGTAGGSNLYFYTGDSSEQSPGYMRVQAPQTNIHQGQLDIYAPYFDATFTYHDSRLTLVSGRMDISQDSQAYLIASTIQVGDITTLTTTLYGTVVLGTNDAPIEYPWMCHVTNSGAQTIGTGALTAVTFDTEVEDDLNMHSTGANTSRVTVPYTGVYAVAGTVGYAAAGTGQRRFAGIRVNGATRRIENFQVSNAGFSATQSAVCNASGLLFLSANDYVELIAFQDTGGNLNTAVLAGAWPSLQVALIRRTA